MVSAWTRQTPDLQYTAQEISGGDCKGSLVNKSSNANPFRVSYRISLTIALPALVFCTTILIVILSFRSTRASVNELASTLFREVSAQTAGHARDLIQGAVHSMSQLDELSRNGLLSDDRKVLGKQLMALLRGKREYSWVSFSGEDGSFTGAHRDLAGKYLLNFSWIVNGKTRLEEYTVADDGTWTLVRESDDHGYDPRTRDFYRIAMEAGRGRWTSPYVFFEGVPGITYASPRIDTHGAVAGVFTIDFDLSQLTRVVGSVRISDNGIIFVFMEDGTLLAHPQARIVKQSEGAEGTLINLEGLSDGLSRGYAREGRQLGVFQSHGETSDLFRFEEAGVQYVASATRFEVSPELTPLVGIVVPEADFMGSTIDTLLRSLLIAFAGLIIAAVLAIIFATWVARPLNRMAGEMDRVGRFELDGDITQASVFREIAAMQRSLSGMRNSLRSFASFVPRDLVRSLLASGKEARLEGETRELTIFFSDIAGFTTLAESMAPDTLVQRLGGYLSEMTTIIGDEQGTVDKFLGDGILAFWGAPEPMSSHATRAVIAAIRCQERLAAMRAGNELERASALDSRIGIATGHVLVGNIGTAERMNYTVLGDTVNLAARLESLCKRYGVTIVISESTAIAIASEILCRPIDLVAVKGKSQAVTIFEPLGTVAGLHREVHGEIVALSMRGFTAYREARFSDAVTAYTELVARFPDDLPSKLLLERSEGLLLTGVPEGWSGVETMTDK